jgi:hypothetical protein
MDARDKLPDVRKFYDKFHLDYDGMVMYTMCLLGDKEVPKRLLAEAQAAKREDGASIQSPCAHLLMYDDADCQKYFFDLLMKDTPGLDEVFCYALRSGDFYREMRQNPIDSKLAVTALEKILTGSKKNALRARLTASMAGYAEKEPEVVKVLQRFAEHAVEVCEEARKVIPELGDKDEDVRKKAREELEKLGLDATPAFEEGLKKYEDAEIQKALKELLDKYKASNTGY